MKREAKIVLVLGVVAVAGYLFWRWYQARQAAAQGGQGAVSQLGSNLNSIAPELVGGSAGPSSGPQVTMPVTISLTESATPRGLEPESPAVQMQPVNVPPLSPVTQDNVTGDGMAGDSQLAMNGNGGDDGTGG